MATIRILPLETSRRIAAGEVIDRPASALRELLDNAIDAGGRDISVSIAQGGIQEVSVADDGSGMSREDLTLSIQEHATSKIYEPDDILKATTLGFRGEALASIAAVARVEIVTRPRGAEGGWQLSCAPLQAPLVASFACREGTRVTMRGLFESYPARKQFLKRPQSEALLCRAMFVERAMAHPAITFRWRSNADLDVLMPGSQRDRVLQCYPELSRMPTMEVEFESSALRATLVYGDITAYRRDRRLLQVFINRRRVPEWGILSLMEYEFGKYLPGGAHAIAFLFLEIDPSLADFNIHPAKREVRLKNSAEVRAAIHDMLTKELDARYGGAPSALEPRLPQVEEFAFPVGERSAIKPYGELGNTVLTADRPRERDFVAYPSQSPRTGLPEDFWERVQSGEASMPRYIGRGPGPFILFELNSALVILDQHAAHERILYDRITSRQGESQPLLVPYVLEPQENDHYIEECRENLAFVGYGVLRDGETWIVDAVPSIAASQSLEALIEWLEQPLPPRTSPLDAIAASLACKAAIKDGDILDQHSAEKLIAQALALPEPRCPHGRPVFISLPREKLYTMFGRVVE